MPLQSGSGRQHSKHSDHFVESAANEPADQGRALLLEALRISEERYKTLLMSSGEAIFRVDLPTPINMGDQSADACALLKQGVFVECNELFAELFSGDKTTQFIGRRFAEVYTNCEQAMQSFIDSNFSINDFEFSFQNTAGEKVFVNACWTGVVNNGCLIRLWGAIKDITESKRYLELLIYQANHDPLTKLPNRDWFKQQVSEYFESWQHQPMAMLLFDLDKFKEINDTLGHTIGDRVLTHIADRIKHCVHDKGLLARLGGDEFAVFLPDSGSKDQAMALANKVEASIKQIIVIDGMQMALGCSTGIALAPDHGSDTTAMLRCADIAMYEAKLKQNGPEFYSPDCDHHSAQRLSLVASLGQAIRKDQLVLHFQPKINLSDNRVSGFEALVRWQHPEQGLIFPDKFIFAAEMTNLIKPLTRIVIEKSLQQLAVWHKDGFACDVAVNLSARNLMDPGLVPFVSSMLDKYRIPSRYLQIEITESSLMSDPERALEILQELSDMGLEIMIDDFGTGYSSLSYLKRLPVSALKIDRSFVFTMLKDEQDEIIVASTINLAHNLRLAVIAEGVEDQQTIDSLKGMGCDLVQGYHISKPLGVEAINKWLGQTQYCLPSRSSVMKF